MTINLAIVYYSSTGFSGRIAQEIGDAAEKAGATVRVRRVAELAPEAAIASNPVWAAHAAETAHIPVATPDTWNGPTL
jgi:NAD(P)H dehydrogenase (quinone)